MHDQHLFSPMPTNAVHCSGGAILPTGEISLLDGGNSRSNMPYFMCLTDGGNAGIEADPPNTAAALSFGSAGRRLSASPTRMSAVLGGGSSMVESSSLAFDHGHAAASEGG